MNKQVLLVLQLLFIGLSSCLAQKKELKSTSCCKDDCVNVSIDSSSKLNGEKITYIRFNDGFNDTLEVYLNNVLDNKSFYQTNESTSYTGKMIKWDYSDIGKNKKLNLKVVESNGRYCLDVNLKRGYKTISIYRLSGKWQVTYSNKKGLVYE